MGGWLLILGTGAGIWQHSDAFAIMDAIVIPWCCKFCMGLIGGDVCEDDRTIGGSERGRILFLIRHLMFFERKGLRIRLRIS